MRTSCLQCRWQCAPVSHPSTTCHGAPNIPAPCMWNVHMLFRCVVLLSVLSHVHIGTSRGSLAGWLGLPQQNVDTPPVTQQTGIELDVWIINTHMLFCCGFSTASAFKRTRKLNMWPHETTAEHCKNNLYSPYIPRLVVFLHQGLLQCYSSSSSSSSSLNSSTFDVPRKLCLSLKPNRYSCYSSHLFSTRTRLFAWPLSAELLKDGALGTNTSLVP